MITVDTLKVELKHPLWLVDFSKHGGVPHQILAGTHFLKKKTVSMCGNNTDVYVVEGLDGNDCCVGAAGMYWEARAADEQSGVRILS